MTVVVGVLADRLGAVQQWVPVADNTYGRNFDVRHQFSSMPSIEYRSIQAAEIRVDVDHDRPIGRVAYLELGRGGHLTAVAEIDGSALGEGPWYYSPEILHRAGTDIELKALAITRKPASVALGPIEPFLGSTLAEAARGVRFRDGWSGSVVQRAHEFDRSRKRDQPIVVVDRNPPAPAAELPSAQPAGRIEYRSAQALDVDSGRRQIHLLAAPYDVQAVVFVDGKTMTESFAPSAFRGRQPARIYSTRDHDPSRLIGRVVDLVPDRADGLHATILVSNTELGRETIELASDQVVAGSVGFQVAAGGETRTGTGRRITGAILREIAMTPSPAYPTYVTAVRSHTTTSATPNLDRARQMFAAMHGGGR